MVLPEEIHIEKSQFHAGFDKAPLDFYIDSFYMIIKWIHLFFKKDSYDAIPIKK